MPPHAPTVVSGEVSFGCPKTISIFAYLTIFPSKFQCKYFSFSLKKMK